MLKEYTDTLGREWYLNEKDNLYYNDRGEGQTLDYIQMVEMVVTYLYVENSV